jgi:hypothetical protein
MIVAAEGARASAVRETQAVQRSAGVDAREIDHDEARRLLPLANDALRAARS